MAHFWCIVPFQIMCFGRGQTSLKGIITSPYPEVNLDNFSFPVGGCLVYSPQIVYTPCLHQQLHFILTCTVQDNLSWTSTLYVEEEWAGGGTLK